MFRKSSLQRPALLGLLHYVIRIYCMTAWPSFDDWRGHVLPILRLLALVVNGNAIKMLVFCLFVLPSMEKLILTVPIWSSLVSLIPWGGGAQVSAQTGELIRGMTSLKNVYQFNLKGFLFSGAQLYPCWIFILFKWKVFCLYRDWIIVILLLPLIS